MTRAAAIALVVVALSGCRFELDFCQANDDCPEAFVCSDGACQEKTRVEVTDNVGSDTTWTSDRIWVLNDVITVQPSVNLTIEPGTRILGRPGAALVVRAGGKLIADGTRQAPIVFTSHAPEGQRLPGDWGGVAVLGQAPVNRQNAFLRIQPDELEPPFGGIDANYSCGTLRYVRIEFAGGQVRGEEFLNSLSLAGCGSGTIVDYVQLHFGGDDGLEIFGGTVNIKHIVITRAQDEALDIDLGWQGRGQYIAMQLDAGPEGGVEIDNLQEEPTRPPFTDFRIYNFTLVGSPDSAIQRGITWKAGGAGFFSHGIVMNLGLEAADAFGVEAGDRCLNDECIIRDTMFFQIGPDGQSYFPVAGSTNEDDGSGDDDNGFPEDTYFVQPSLGNVFGVDPGLSDPTNLVAPGWVSDATVITGVDPPPFPFDPTGNYRGAFAPGQIPWTDGWTAYPDH